MKRTRLRCFNAPQPKGRGSNGERREIRRAVEPGKKSELPGHGDPRIGQISAVGARADGAVEVFR